MEGVQGGRVYVGKIIGGGLKMARYILKEPVEAFRWDGNKENLPDWFVEILNNTPAYSRSCFDTFFETPEGSDKEELVVNDEYVEIGSYVYDLYYLRQDYPDDFLEIFKELDEGEHAEDSEIKKENIELRREIEVLATVVKRLLPLGAAKGDELQNLLSMGERVINRVAKRDEKVGEAAGTSRGSDIPGSRA